MTIKTRFFLLSVLVIIGLVINSCKKDNQGGIQTLFVGGHWQLASVMVTNYVGGNIISTDTLNTTCDSIQVFTFNSNNTCTYTNFDCIPQKVSGSWSLSSNQLNLLSTISCKDTVTGGAASVGKPFANALIVNLGVYSMVLETGDINTYYTATTPRTLVQYGFVRVNPPTN